MPNDHNDPQNAAAMRALQAALAQASREAGETRAMLQDAIVSVAAVSQHALAVVGGSAQGVDKALVQSLQDAVHQTRTAIAALVSAAASSRVAS